jgi:hypothetical protein
MLFFKVSKNAIVGEYTEISAVMRLGHPLYKEINSAELCRLPLEYQIVAVSCVLLQYEAVCGQI